MKLKYWNWKQTDILTKNISDLQSFLNIPESEQEEKSWIIFNIKKKVSSPWTDVYT